MPLRGGLNSTRILVPGGTGPLVKSSINGILGDQNTRALWPSRFVVFVHVQHQSRTTTPYRTCARTKMNITIEETSIIGKERIGDMYECCARLFGSSKEITVKYDLSRRTFS